ncbi:MAG: Serine hydroxymethyltransferase [Chlamydiia bacterium]|nr:Serine hydroxymethyltransferase [Chlamydiia bacterium]MCH9616617.1 Serine hydroxymethyltransferase [Chlamydiia bacterium]MCH9629347.1 Serine hydroxymethyltransferase [Chlamydiia bacterium]
MTFMSTLCQGKTAYAAVIDFLKASHPEVASAIVGELKSQRECLKMIASENYSSLAVQLAMGNLLTDKYSEGYPGHRFYAGCEHVDTVEQLAIDELKKLFGCDHAYVQPHSGADANMIAFWAILVHKVQNQQRKKIESMSAEEFEALRKEMCNQKIMGMGLTSGGHLTHGYRHNVSARMFQAVQYDVDPETEELNYDTLEAQVKKERPLILIAGYSAYPKKINFKRMREIADSVGAVFMVDMAHFSGLVAGGVFTGEFNPVPYADIVTSTTHKTLRGPRGGLILCTEEYREVVDKGCPHVIGGPLPHVMAAKAIAFKEANSPEFKIYAQKIVENSIALAESLKKEGVKLFANGTENHLVVADVATSFGLTGRQAELLLTSIGITLNRNTIPFDENGPWYTSGIRLGTAALTSRGFGPCEMEEIAEMIVMLLKAAKPAGDSRAKTLIDDTMVEQMRERVKNLLAKFPLYPELEIG